MKRRIIIVSAAVLMTTFLLGSHTLAAAQDEAAEEEENYETGDASADDPLNEDGIGENELLVVSFGTSFNDSRRMTIGAIEKKMAENFPEWDVRRGFTSQIIIDHVYSYMACKDWPNKCR